MTLDETIIEVERVRSVIRETRATYAAAQLVENTARTSMYAAERILIGLENTRDTLAREANAARYAAQAKK